MLLLLLLLHSQVRCYNALAADSMRILPPLTDSCHTLSNFTIGSCQTPPYHYSLWQGRLTVCLLLAGHLLLASASQDKYLRVWRIQPQSAPQKAPLSTSGPNTTSSNGDLASDIARYCAHNTQKTTPCVCVTCIMG